MEAAAKRTADSRERLVSELREERDAAIARAAELEAALAEAACYLRMGRTQEAAAAIARAAGSAA